MRPMFEKRSFMEFEAERRKCSKGILNQWQFGSKLGLRDEREQQTAKNAKKSQYTNHLGHMMNGKTQPKREMRKKEE